MDFTRPVEAVIPGARGRLLGVLARTTDPLSLRSLAELAGVSAAQAARIVPDLVLLGIVERREAPPASLVWLASCNLAADLIRRLADIRTELLEGLRRTAAEIRPAPVSLVLFGSFARGDASAESDLDVLAVRPRSVPEGDDGWTSALAGWTDRARRLSGNTVNLVEVGQEELRNLLRRPTALWREIAGAGILLFGSPLVEWEVGQVAEKTVRKLSRADVKAYVRKSEQYLEAAEESFEGGRYDAAASAAIHAGISAADAITGGRSGVRSSGPDHAAALGLLERAGPDGIEAAKLLRRLLPLKNLAEYDSAPVTRTRATSALRAARALVSIGRRVGASLG